MLTASELQTRLFAAENHAAELATDNRRLRAALAATLPPTQAALDVLAERRRQVEAESRTPAHDDEYSGGELACAAACYAFNAAYPGSRLLRTFWPWSESWWKPTTARRDLVKSAALALAEIERQDRIESPEAGG